MNMQDIEDFTGFEGGASTAYSSPGAPAVFDLAGNAHIGTVSPQDLLVQDPYMSAPNSSALTALTSPSPYESPDFMDGYDVSPSFGSGDFTDSGPNAWFSLFPDQPAAGNVASDVLVPVAEAAGKVTSASPEPSEPTKVSVSRRKSSGSPHVGPHASVAGVGSRKRDKPLPPIVIDDPNDTVAMKRARNTLAARKSRERKAQRFEDLEEKIRELEAERDHWKNIALSRG